MIVHVPKRNLARNQRSVSECSNCGAIAPLVTLDKPRVYAFGNGMQMEVDQAYVCRHGCTDEEQLNV